MGSLQAAVIGLGFMGRAHIEALRRLGIEVRGVVGSTREKAQKVAKSLGISHAYKTYAEAVADPLVSVIHLCTPNDLHYPQARQALEAGKHVICEKPLAMNPAESRKLVDLAYKTGLVAAVNYNLRYYPACQEALARARAGELGSPYLIFGGYLQDWLFLKTDWNWRLEPERGGNLRVVADIGTHWMDMVTYLTGLRVRSVFADFSTTMPTRMRPLHEVETFASKIEKVEAAEEIQIHTEDVAVVLFRFENGALGNVTLSQVSAGRKNHFWWEISGSKTSMWWDQENPNELWIGHRDEPNQLLLKDPALYHPEVARLTGFPGGHAEGYPDTFVQCFRQVYGAIQSGKMPETGQFATFEDGHIQMLLCQAIRRSAEENRWVEIAEEGDEEDENG